MSGQTILVVDDDRATVMLLTSLLRKDGYTVVTTIYQGAPHAFFNDQRSSYREPEARDAWEKVLGYFRRHLE